MLNAVKRIWNHPDLPDAMIATLILLLFPMIVLTGIIAILGF